MGCLLAWCLDAVGQLPYAPLPANIQLTSDASVALVLDAGASQSARVLQCRVQDQVVQCRVPECSVLECQSGSTSYS